MRHPRLGLATLTILLLTAATAAAQDGPHRHGRPATRPAKPTSRPAAPTVATTRPARYTADGTVAAVVRPTYTALPGDAAVVVVAHRGSLTLADPTALAAGLRAESDGTLTVVGGTVATTADRASAVFADDGTVTLTGGMLSTAGLAAPAVHARGKVIATDTVASAAAAEAVVVEGAHSATFTRCTLAGNRDRGVLIFQSGTTVGDPGTGRAYFTMTGGLLTTGRGPAIQVTNQLATIQLTDVALSARGGVLVAATGGRWGRRDHNGGQVTLRAVHQTLAGDLTADPVSTLDVTLAGGSTLTGRVSHASLTLAADSKWVVTADSALVGLTDADGLSGRLLGNIVGNGHAVRYDASAAANAWLKGRTYDLANSGTLSPNDR